jgi:hypothetical protein
MKRSFRSVVGLDGARADPIGNVASRTRFQEVVLTIEMTGRSRPDLRLAGGFAGRDGVCDAVQERAYLRNPETAHAG